VSRSYSPGKVDAARHEKNVWKRRASSAELALNRIQSIFRHADEEAGADGARTDYEILEDIWTVIQDWQDAVETAPDTPIRSLKVKAYIYPLTGEEWEKSQTALDKWACSDAPLRDGVSAVLDALAELRDPTMQRGPGL
jgi:hypothetical protein